jgi:hypothetical protein
MTITKLYKNLNENKITKSDFLSEVRKNLPQWITPLMSLKDTIMVLKNKGIIKEDIGNYDNPDFWEDYKTDFPDAYKYIDRIKNGVGWITDDQLFNELPDDMSQGEKAQIMYALAKMGLLYSESGLDDPMGEPNEDSKMTPEDVDNLLNNTNSMDSVLNNITNSNLNESKFEESEYPKFANKDRVNYGEYRCGLKLEMEKGKNFEAAEKIVLRNLLKDPIYYTNLKAGIKPKKNRSDVMVPVKGNSLVDKKNGTTRVSKEKQKNSAVKVKDETLKVPKRGVKYLDFKPKRAKGIKGVMDLPGKEKKIRLKETLLDDNIEDNNGKDKRQCIKDLIIKTKKNGGDNIEDIHFDLEEYGLNHDELLKVLYKLCELGLVKGDNGQQINTSEVDSYIDNLERNGEAAPGGYGVEPENILSSTNLNEEDSLHNYMDIDPKLAAKLESYSIFKGWVGSGLLEIHPKIIYYSDKIKDKIEKYIKPKDDIQEEENCNCGFTKGETFDIAENIGKFTKGEKVTVSEIKVRKNDVALIIENKNGIKDTFFIDKNDK